MPSLITHYIFAKKEYSKCVDKFNFLVGNFDAFAMGNQGLNIFSYNDRIFDFNYDWKFFSEEIIVKVFVFFNPKRYTKSLEIKEIFFSYFLLEITKSE